ncbi:MAG: STAS-like domain-containing protein [Methanimicrococcus sp.]|nr:STAS-like domain-containing protein [Methanimicrococcus sp.]
MPAQKTDIIQNQINIDKLEGGMKIKIEAKNHISNGFSADDADILSQIINDGLKKDSKITIDFENVKYFTSLFFNLAITRYLDEMTVEEYDSRIKIINLSEVGMDAYALSYENAVEYYRLSPKEREAREKIVSDATEMVI